jgi:hypothetical protein
LLQNLFVTFFVVVQKKFLVHRAYVDALGLRARALIEAGFEHVMDKRALAFSENLVNLHLSLVGPMEYVEEPTQ